MGGIPTSPMDEPTDSPLFVDLEPVLSGDLTRELPTIGRTGDGDCLLYQGRVNEIHGEPGGGKSNVALAFTAQVLGEGRPVIYIDPEDTARTAVTRLVQFGCSRTDILAHLHYVQDPDLETLTRAIAWAQEHRPALVVMDGLAELLTLAGLNEDAAADVLTFVRAFARPYARAGAAVLITDHVAKDRDGRGRWSRGSGAKLGAYDGVSCDLRVVEPYSPAKAGRVELRVAKDRLGGVGAMGAVAGEVEFTPWEGGTRVTIRGAAGTGAASNACDEMMRKICEHLEAHPDAVKRDLRDLGHASTVDEAIDELEKLGRLQVERGGPGKRNHYRLIPLPTDE